MKHPTYKETSEYRAITWREGDRTRSYQLGQYLTAHVDKESGKPYKAYVYSIEDSSGVVHSASNTFERRILLSMIDKEGQVFKWYEIINPQDVTLMYSHEHLTVI